jgi:DNA-binding FadR family transcriptional regulator
MVMRRYPDRGVHGQVVESLGRQIVARARDQEESLDSADLAAQYGVSRTVVREALKVLAGKGLVDARPRRGTFVRSRDDWNLLDPDILRWRFAMTTGTSLFGQLHEVRAILEPSAAELAAVRHTDQDLAALAEALDGIAVATGPESIADADLRFHRAIFTATHNDLIDQLAILIEIGLDARDRLVHSRSWSTQETVARHRAVAEAIAAADAPRARLAMTALVEEADRAVRDLPAQG